MNSFSSHAIDTLKLLGKRFGVRGSRPSTPPRNSPADDLNMTDLDMTGKVKRLKKVTGGGYSDVWTGIMKKNGQKVQVAIKELRVRTSEGSVTRERLKKRLFREISVWRNLRHQNVVPLLGYTIASDGLPSMISPWYPNGNVVLYLQSNPRIKRLPLILDAARGLCYLHSLSLVHGDIKGDNILVNAHGSASLCDFGMSKFIDDALHMTGFTTTNAHTGGTVRFLSPELLDNDPKSTKSDIWAFACVIVQIMTDQIPYHHIPNNVVVARAIDRGDRPYSDDFVRSTVSLTGTVLIKICKCWEKDPVTRPDAETLLAHIQVSDRSSPIMVIDSEVTSSITHSRSGMITPGHRPQNLTIHTGGESPPFGDNIDISNETEISGIVGESTNRSRQPQLGIKSSTSPRVLARTNSTGAVNPVRNTLIRVKDLGRVETPLSLDKSSLNGLPTPGVEGAPEPLLQSDKADAYSFVSSRASTDGYTTPRRWFNSGLGRRPSSATRGSQADLSASIKNVYRGFDFSQEEIGSSIRRAPSHSSSWSQSKISLPVREKNSHERKGSMFMFPKLRKSLKEKKKSEPTVGRPFSNIHGLEAAELSLSRENVQAFSHEESSVVIQKFRSQVSSQSSSQASSPTPMKEKNHYEGKGDLYLFPNSRKSVKGSGPLIGKSCLDTHGSRADLVTDPGNVHRRLGLGQEGDWVSIQNAPSHSSSGRQTRISLPTPVKEKAPQGQRGRISSSPNLRKSLGEKIRPGPGIVPFHPPSSFRAQSMSKTPC